MRTATEMSSLIGTHCYLEPVRGLQFRCRVTDVKTSYGRARIQIEAIEGAGRAWVAVESVSPCYPDSATNKQGGRSYGSAS